MSTGVSLAGIRWTLSENSAIVESRGQVRQGRVACTPTEYTWAGAKAWHMDIIYDVRSTTESQVDHNLQISRHPGRPR